MNRLNIKLDIKPNIKQALAALLTSVMALVYPLSTLAADTGAIDTPTEVTAKADPFVSAMSAGRNAVKAKNWTLAAKDFDTAVKLNAKSADAHNMLAYSARHLNDYPRARKHYDEALRLEPNHRGAHEYVGIMYLKLNQLPDAQKHLAALEKICNKKCEEYDDLSKAIAAYTKK